MAEINVPACPIPIHQTKLMMSNPQPTGFVTPQVPVPTKRRFAKVWASTITRTKPIPKPTYQPRGVLRASTTELILSVTEPNVWPGSMIGAASASRVRVFEGWFVSMNA